MLQAEDEQRSAFPLSASVCDRAPSIRPFGGSALPSRVDDGRIALGWPLRGRHHDALMPLFERRAGDKPLASVPARRGRSSDRRRTRSEAPRSGTRALVRAAAPHAIG